MSDLQVNPIEEVLEEFAKGNIVIMVDDQDRENEGDLFVAAEVVHDQHINFMASSARGLICLALTEERWSQLELPLLVRR
ncbi:MAG: 3,4-dihydroxy-2-butanone-4-phosphate synthase, partial [Gammaproteobacteria bacterium]|nr:3,4-dihydroxy-2-butanone-4-phosphate synthase [Gammaproteobacteria bacterium]